MRADTECVCGEPLRRVVLIRGAVTDHVNATADIRGIWAVVEWLETEEGRTPVIGENVPQEWALLPTRYTLHRCQSRPGVVRWDHEPGT